MTNPWLKKNPFMSLWLSGVNKVAGSMRGHAAAQAKRQAAAATTNATRGILSFWTGALAPAKRKKKPR
jgi:putative copper export protein